MKAEQTTKTHAETKQRKVRKINKKGLSGFAYSFYGMISLIGIMLIIVALQVNTAVPDQKPFNQTLIDNTLNWSKYNNFTKDYELSENHATNVIFDIVFRFIDFLGYTAMEVVKVIVDFGVKNPNVVNWKVLLYLFIAALLAPLIWPLFLIIVSLILIIKEAIKNKREKRKLETLRREANKNAK